MIATFLLIPVVLLAFNILLAGASSHNAIASARYGASVYSTDSEQRYEARQRQVNGRDPVRVTLNDAESQVKKTIAYLPRIQGRVLEAGGDPMRPADPPASYSSFALVNIAPAEGIARIASDDFFQNNPTSIEDLKFYDGRAIDVTATSKSRWTGFQAASRSQKTHDNTVYFWRRSPQHYDDRIMMSHQLTRLEFHTVNAFTSLLAVEAVAGMGIGVTGSAPGSMPDLGSINDCADFSQLGDDLLEMLGDTCTDILSALEDNEAEAADAVDRAEEQRDDAQTALDNARAGDASASEIGRLEQDLSAANSTLSEAQSNLNEVRDSQARIESQCGGLT